jgi:hypothetical protein
MHIGYWRESQKEDKDVGGWTILKWISDRIGCDLAQVRDQWMAPINTVMMSLQVPLYAGKFFSSTAIDDFSRWAQLHEVS